MSKNVEKIKTGWPIPTFVKESFVEFCAEMGTLAQEDCAGALLIWQYLPAQTREEARLQAKGAKAIDENFWKQFSYGIALGVQAQLNIQPKKPDEKK